MWRRNRQKWLIALSEVRPLPRALDHHGQQKGVPRSRE
jgi:hypothetical protein